jgi:hypothetical protein
MPRSATEERPGRRPAGAARPPARTDAGAGATRADGNGHGPGAAGPGATAATVLRLQAGAGNGAVAALLARRQGPAGPPGRDGPVVQRLAPDPTAPPVAPSPPAPETDPRFATVTGKVAGQGRALKRHPPARAEITKARAAAKPPANDKASQAKAGQADKMHQAKPGEFNEAAFIAAVEKAIAAAAPKSLAEADKLGSSGKTAAVKTQVMGKVTEGKRGSAKDVEQATAAPPDESGAVPKPVTPLAPEPGAPRPADPGAAGAMPAPAPEEQTNLQSGKHETEQEMAAEDVTEQQVAGQGEPEFDQAVAAKKEGEAHSAAAPAQVREEEQAVLTQASSGAAASTRTRLAGMATAKAAGTARVGADKQSAKAREEAERARVAARIEAIYAATKADTEAILNGLDAKVAKEFETGEAAARKAFEESHSREMRAYKKQRYSGLRGKWRWVRDKFKGLPEEVNRFYERARELYLAQMKQVIARVARLIGGELTRAKQRIATGRQEIATYVASLPANLRKFGAEKQKEVAEKFTQLESDVDAKQQDLVQDLAKKYVEARNAVDERIKAMQEENKGLWDKAKALIKGVIEAIRKLKDLLLGMLARVAGAVRKIIKGPIRFLGNLVKAVKGGLSRFVANIGEHLKRGLMGWLMGSMASAGVELPSRFDLKGIIQLILSLLGLTWANIRARLVKAFGRNGERVVSALEKTFGFVKVLATEGPMGLVRLLMGKLGELKAMVLDKIKEFVVVKVITAGITWLVSLLNPAAAFIKACKMIVDIVMFFIERGSEIIEFVNTVIDSIGAIVSGAVAAAAAAIERTLAKILPLAISFLASLIGLGGIAGKVKSIFDAARKPVGKIVGGLIKGAVKFGRKLLSKLSRKIRGGDDSPAGKLARLRKGLDAAAAAVNRYAGRPVAEKLLKPLLAGVRVRYGLASLAPVKAGARWAVLGRVNPEDKKETGAEVKADVEAVKAMRKARDRVRSSVREAQKLIKQGKIKAALARDPSRQEALTKRLGELADEFGKTGEKRFKDLVDKGTPEQVQAEQTRYQGLAPEAATIEQALSDLGKSPEELAKEMDALRKQIAALIKRAEEVSADPAVQREVLTNPNYAGLATEIATGITTVKEALAAEKAAPGSIDDLRRLFGQADALRRAADRAERLRDPGKQADEYMATIRNIITETTIAGRPAAGLKTGESEHALIWEAEHGEPYKSEEGHYLKVPQSRGSLETAVKELTVLLARVTDATKKKEIEAAIKDGEARAAGLKSGEAVWNARVSTYPDVWHADGKSKKRPGWPKG